MTNLALAPIKVLISAEMFNPAAYETFDGTLESFEFDLGPDHYTLVGDANYDINITNTGEAFLVAGQVHAQAKTECARCLEDATFDIEGEVEGYFLISVESADEDDEEAQDFDVLPDDHKIDLAPLIQAAICLDLPVQPLCKDDCLGLCPKCGENLNAGPCNCKDAEPELDPLNPFAKLKSLKFD
jgi:uncharacterized protein